MLLVALEKIFHVSHGNKMDFNKMHVTDEGGVAFVGRSGLRNGFVGYVERNPTVEPYDAGLITVALGGAALSSFVQPADFYTAQNIDVLRPRYPMSLDVKLYYCLCIQANRFRYSTYGREANRTLRYLEVPQPSEVPEWVEGTRYEALTSLSGEIQQMAVEQGGRR